ncbi:MAG: hypothetical protein OXT71_11005 [Acidobacteriota bacterium]|nr:hypothetical protein [Acidobacteriota bacterium]
MMRFRLFLLHLFLFVFLTVQGAVAGTPGLLNRPALVEMGDRLELFVDHHLIDRLEGARLKLHHPSPAETVIRGDRPWEGELGFGQTVILHQGKYLLYYHGSNKLCYAESGDGVHWTKPALGLIEAGGSRQNNLVGTAGGEYLYDHLEEPAARVYLDTRPGVPAGRRLIALKLDEGHRANPTEEELARRLTVNQEGFWQGSPTDVIPWVSKDGRAWERLGDKPLFRNNLYGTLDGDFSFFWSEVEQQYVIYSRYFTSPNRSVGRRAIARLTAPNLYEWSEFQPMSYGDGGTIPENHLYINLTLPYYRAPQIYLAFPARLMVGRQVLTDEDAQAAGVPEGRWMDTSETVLMTTRGPGNRYDTTFREGFIRPGPGARNWITRTTFALRGVVPTGPREISMYVSRETGTRHWHIRRYVLRVDGFASVNAPYDGGEMVTRPLTFSGKELLLNTSTSGAGSVRVEIQSSNGEPVAGYALEDSMEIVGDEIERVAAWQNGTDVSPLAGQPVRLCFVLKDADLYSIRFR